MTAVISPPMFLQFADSAGVPLAGAKIFSYLAGTSTKTPTWTDSTQHTINGNPGVLDSAGRISVWLDPTVPTKLLVAPANSPDPPTTTLAVQDYINAFVSQAQLGQILIPQSSAEAAALVTPVNYFYPVGHLYRYGTNSVPGTTDMTTACQNWAAVGGSLSMPLPDIVLVSGVITLVSNTTISIVDGATFKTNTANQSVFKASSKSNITIRGGKVQQTVNGSTVHIGLIEYTGCTNCKAIGVELVGAQHNAVLLNGSSQCLVADCYVHDSLGNTQADCDSTDIAVYGASSFNTVRNNICYGGTAVEHGVMVQDPGSSLIPLKNLVDGNKVGPHKSYGILNYMIDHANTYCTIVNNEVEGVTGTAQSGGSGSGIYNQGAGGTIIGYNTIRNCCVNTSNQATLLPSGIDLNLDPAMLPVLVIGNHIYDTVNGDAGIAVSGGGAMICDNVIVQNAGNNTNVGIHLNAASNVQVMNNRIKIDTSIASGHGIFAFANGSSFSNVTIDGNYILGTNLRGIRVDTTGAPTLTNAIVSNNVVSGGTAAAIPLQLANMIDSVVSGNVASATTVQALDVASCLTTRFTGNVLRTTGTLAVNIAGTSTGSYYDKSNYANTSIKNAATGLICEQLASATPASGFNSAVGDRIEQSVPVVGNPKGWRCTVAGNPGTWQSEGNL